MTQLGKGTATCHICGVLKECTRSMLCNGIKVYRCAACDYARAVTMSTAQALNQADAKRLAKSRKAGNRVSAASRKVSK